MCRLGRSVLFGLLVTIALLIPARAAIAADNTRLLTGFVWSLQRSMLESGVWLWKYEQATGGRNILPAVAQGLDEWSQATGVYMAHSADRGAVQRATGGLEFVYGDGRHQGCGVQATACVWGYAGDFGVAYDSVSMAAWMQRSQVSVVLHEFAHVAFDLNEQYATSGGRIGCTNKDYTVMDCGLFHLNYLLSDFDRESVEMFVVPGPVPWAVLDLSGNWGEAVVWYGPSRKQDDAGRWLDRFVWPGGVLSGKGNCTRVTAFSRTVGFEDWAWLGAYSRCGEYEAIAVPKRACTEYWVGAENALSMSWARNLVYAGTVGCE